jgi:hypothetical protein
MGAKVSKQMIRAKRLVLKKGYSINKAATTCGVWYSSLWRALKLDHKKEDDANANRSDRGRLDAIGDLSPGSGAPTES